MFDAPYNQPWLANDLSAGVLTQPMQHPREECVDAASLLQAWSAGGCLQERCEGINPVRANRARS